MANATFMSKLTRTN